MVWTPEDEPRLRQQAIEKAEAEQEGFLPRKAVLDALRLERAEMDRYHHAYAYRMAAEALHRVEKVISAMEASFPQPPTKDQT